MNPITRLALTTFAILWSGSALAADCQLKSYDELTLKPADQERSAFTVMLDGRSFRGAFEPALPHSEVRAYVPENLDKPIKSQIREDDVTLNDLALGRLKVTRPTVVVGKASQGPDILLGQEILGLVDLELDLANDKIRLFAQEHCSNQIVYWSNEHYEMPFQDTRFGGVFEALVNGKPVRATLSPNALHSTIDPEQLTALGLARPGGAAIPLETLEFGGVRLRHVAVAASKADTGAASPPELVLGADVLRHFRLYIASNEHKIYFTVANGS